MTVNGYHWLFPLGIGLAFLMLCVFCLLVWADERSHR